MSKGDSIEQEVLKTFPGAQATFGNGICKIVTPMGHSLENSQLNFPAREYPDIIKAAWENALSNIETHKLTRTQLT